MFHWRIPIKKKKKININILRRDTTLCKANYKSVTLVLHHKMCSLSNSIKHYKCSPLWHVNNVWINFLSQKNSSEWRVIKIFTAFYWRSKLSNPLLTISYHHISSVTVNSCNRHPECRLPAIKTCSSWYLEPWRWDRMVIPKHRNGITI